MVTSGETNKKTKWCLSLSGYVRYFHISVAAHRQRPAVTHRQLIKWLTCLVTGSQWQTASPTASWMATSWLTCRLVGCCLSFFLSLHYSGLNSRRLTCQSNWFYTFFLLHLHPTPARNFLCHLVSTGRQVPSLPFNLPPLSLRFAPSHCLTSGEVDLLSCSLLAPPHFLPGAGAVVSPLRQPRWLWEEMATFTTSNNTPLKSLTKKENLDKTIQRNHFGEIISDVSVSFFLSSLTFWPGSSAAFFLSRLSAVKVAILQATPENVGDDKSPLSRTHSDFNEFRQGDWNRSVQRSCRSS